MKTNQHYLFFSLCVLASLLTIANCKVKPKPASEYFTLCKRNDIPKLNECVKNSMMRASSGILKNGIPALGLVPLEPLVIPRLELNQGSGTFALKTVLTNFTFHKLSTNNVKSVDIRFDDKNFFFDVIMTTPKVETTSNYDIDGQILILPIKGQGICEMNFTDLYTNGKTVGKFVTRNGKRHVLLETITWEIGVNYKETRTWFHNLFNGDKRLGDATNNFLNENQEDAFLAIKHLPEEAFGQVFRDLAQKVYDAYPFDELFPPQ